MNPYPPVDNRVTEQKVVSVVLVKHPSHDLPKLEMVEDPVEAERLANWKANFPYQPTTDPDVVITKEILENGDHTLEINYLYLRSFFESEARFTAQFEQLYCISEEHGRGGKPGFIACCGIIIDTGKKTLMNPAEHTPSD